MDEVGAVVEGYYAAASAHDLAARTGIEMPIAEAAYQALYEDLGVEEALRGLMGRDRRHELEENWLFG